AFRACGDDQGDGYHADQEQSEDSNKQSNSCLRVLASVGEAALHLYLCLLIRIQAAAAPMKFDQTQLPGLRIPGGCLHDQRNFHIENVDGRIKTSRGWAA